MKPSIEAGRAVYRPHGTFKHYDAAAMVRDAVAYCAAHGARELLADLSEVTLSQPPSIVSRAESILSWRDAANGKVRLALVLKRDLITTGDFGNTFSRNIRFDSRVFGDPEEARRWLDARAAADPAAG